MRSIIAASGLAAAVALAMPLPTPAGPPLPGRTEDPVILTGSDVPMLAGAPIGSLAAMKWDGSSFAPIPFQVDERDPSGEFAFAQGEEKSRDPDPGLDPNDEIVFMAFDSGPRADAAKAPPGAVRGAEVCVRDPAGPSAYVYLFVFEGDPPRSASDYVNMSLDTERELSRVEAKSYIIESVSNAVYYNYLSLRRDDGTWTPDLIDRLKIRGTIYAIFGTVKIDFNFDELVKSRITAWIDGPVRVVRKGRGFMQIPGVEIQGSGHSLSYFYPTYFIYPMTIDIPINLRTLLTDMDFRGSTDFSSAAYVWHYYDSGNPLCDGVVFDGSMSAAEKALDRGFDHDWHVMTGEQGTFFHRLFFPDEWDFIDKKTFYLDDAGALDPPEDDPGVISSGYEFENFIELKKGLATYYMHYYFPVDFKPGDEQRILNVVDRPLETEASEFPAAAGEGQ